MNTAAALVFALISVAVVLSLARRRAPLPPPETEEGFNLRAGLAKPTLWWFVDADEPNARHWADFGARNSRQPNRGYLQIALKKVYETQGAQYNVHPLIGRAATLAQINGANPRALQLPPDIWRSYVIANLAAQKGGLVVDGNSTLFIAPMAVPAAGAAAVGTAPDEPRVSPQTAVAPGPAPYVGWAAAPGHPAWTYAAQQYNALVEAGQQAWGAAQARRAFLTIWEAQRALGATILRGIDGSRRADGTKLQLGDVFGTTRLQLPAETVYITYDGDDLARRYEFNWFLRMSPAQIAEASCAWCIAARERSP
jgi:hypothetical protein